MYCGKCGSQNPNDAAFCSHCGAKFVRTDASSASSDAPQSKATSDSPKSTHTKKPVVPIVILILVVAAFFLFSGRSPKRTVRQFMSLYTHIDKINAKKVLKLFPDEIVNAMCEEEEMDLEDLQDELDDQIQDQLEFVEGWANIDFSDVSISYKIVEIASVDDDDLRDIKREYRGTCKISNAKEATVKLTGKYDGEENSATIDFALIKVGKSWYIEPGSLYSLTSGLEDLFY